MAALVSSQPDDGSPVQLITNDLSWKGAVTEAPRMIQENGACTSGGGRGSGGGGGGG